MVYLVKCLLLFAVGTASTRANWDFINESESNEISQTAWSDSANGLIKPKNISIKASQILEKLRQDLDDPEKSGPGRVFLSLGMLLCDIWCNTYEETTREVRLSSFGKVGDVVNNSLQIFLNALTTWLYHDASPDCGRRLLCEAQQEAQTKGWVYTALNYLSSFAVSLTMKEQRLQDGIAAMRSGREGLSCRSIYPNCPISL